MNYNLMDRGIDGISSATALFQLIEQTIYILQQFYQVREAIRGAPNTIKDLEVQLDALLGTLDSIQREPVLDKPIIRHQVIHIYGIAEELKGVASSMQARQSKGKVRQAFYFLVKKPRDDGRLLDILSRLRDAKAELSLQVEVAHVGVTSSMATGIQKIEEIHKTRHQERPLREFRLEGNTSTQNARQFNGIMGFERADMSALASITDNHSAGDSRQQNAIVGDTTTFPKSINA
ncbi:hypothetical protein QBC40DRAFT_263269 [Triangularia verruculosa]|uniref:NACHT-NTPase and P-loop NTPases N-terminal domain-containing protein n=1 Tax=Triangularia verruculosa TaxID=2587418 RepID=A0AAN6XQC7_9PEZI|nr:hypothetical protein QBC40DRAFT_263269 [Triangularia verruculosa]